MREPALIVDAPPVVYWNSTPYALAFSPDGARLAIGSGGWYGLGGVSLFDLERREESALRFVPPHLADSVTVAPGEVGQISLTISGVAFDDSGDLLAACAWSSGQHRGPALLFDVADGGLALREALVLPDARQTLDGGPTGICLSRGRLHVRSNVRQLEDVLCSLDVPTIGAAGTYAHRSHARIARVGDELITGGGGSLKLGGWSREEGEYEGFKATTGLVVGMPARGVPAPGDRITALVAPPGGGLITGGLGGELIAWDRDDRGWRPKRSLRHETTRTASVGGAWATYRPASVVGLCALEDGRLFSVDASGEVLEWRDDAVATARTPPRPGTARCIAVHPHTPLGPLLAVGFKVEGETRRGYVACWSLE